MVDFNDDGQVFLAASRTKTEPESVFRHCSGGISLVGTTLPFPLLLLSFYLVRGDVGSEEVTALVKQLDKLHHGLLLLHVTQGSPLFPAHGVKWR